MPMADVTIEWLTTQLRPRATLGCESPERKPGGRQGAFVKITVIWAKWDTTRSFRGAFVQIEKAESKCMND
ncbi:hypothetical protein SAMN05444166_5307 [Singulisphaera sp. GP187]|nr:hypothetical protein SAMN05444166_5307 [Singulisphaera sp. GP187]